MEGTPERRLAGTIQLESVKTLFIRYAVHIQIMPAKAPETKKTHVEAKFNSFCLF